MMRLISSVGNRYFVALQYADYRWVWAAGMAGASAYWALIVARGILVLDMSGSSAMVGLVTFGAMAPRIVIPPLAGYVADRFERRTVLRFAYAGNLVNNAVLTALALSGALEVWHVILLSVTNGTIRSYQMTASSTLVPNLIPRHHLLNAVSLNMMSVQGSRLVGPGIIAPVLIIFGAPEAFLASTFFYALGLALVLRVQTRSTGGINRGQSVASGLAQAIGVVYRHPQLRMIILLVLLHCGMTMSFESVFPTFSRDSLGAGSGGFSYLMMAVGAGGLVFVLLTAGVRGDWARGRLLFLTGIVSGISMVTLALSTNLVTASISAVALGASQGSFMAIAMAWVQGLAPEAMRGRVNGLYQLNFGGAMALVNLTNGVLADSINPALLLGALGASFVVVMGMSIVLATVRRMYLVGVPIRAMPADAPAVAGV